MQYVQMPITLPITAVVPVGQTKFPIFRLTRADGVIDTVAVSEFNANHFPVSIDPTPSLLSGVLNQKAQRDLIRLAIRNAVAPKGKAKAGDPAKLSRGFGYMAYGEGYVDVNQDRDPVDATGRKTDIQHAATLSQEAAAKWCKALAQMKGRKCHGDVTPKAVA